MRNHDAAENPQLPRFSWEPTWRDSLNSFLYGLTFGAFGRRWIPPNLSEIIDEAERIERNRR